MPIRFLIVAPLALLAGCAAPSYFVANASPVHAAPEVGQTWDMEAPRHLPIFIGTADAAGAPLMWNELMEAVAWAQVVIIGEQHDDEMGHFFQQAVVEDVLARWPRSAVSMEMLERDLQGIADDYLEGIIDQPMFVRLARTEGWGGREKKWDSWYQPMIDAAKESGGRVVAANAPRRYVRLARTDGYGRLRALPADRRALFSLPVSPMGSPYRDRFVDLMMSARGHGDADDDEEEESEEEREARRQRVTDSFRSQFLWDATMAASIARARPSVERKVVHMIGQFHSDFEGGTVRELRRRLPGVRILTISMQRVGPEPMREGDIGRADVIVHTGERPPREEPAEEDVEGVEEAEDEVEEANDEVEEAEDEVEEGE